MTDTLFIVLCVASLFSAFMTVLSRIFLHAILYLLMTIFLICGMMVLLKADTLAAFTFWILGGTNIMLLLCTLIFLYVPRADRAHHKLSFSRIIFLLLVAFLGVLIWQLGSSRFQRVSEPASFVFFPSEYTLACVLIGVSLFASLITALLVGRNQQS